MDPDPAHAVDHAIRGSPARDEMAVVACEALVTLFLGLSKLLEQQRGLAQAPEWANRFRQGPLCRSLRPRRHSKPRAQPMRQTNY